MIKEKTRGRRSDRVGASEQSGVLGESPRRELGEEQKGGRQVC